MGLPALNQIIPLGSVAQIEIKEEGGNGSVVLHGGGKLGGGSMAGIVGLSVSVEVDCSVIQLADAALIALEKKFPQFAGAIETLKALMDASAKSL